MDTAPGIYLIRNEDQREFFKIGQTSNIGKRLHDLNSCTCHPFTLRLAAFYPLADLEARIKIEKHLHKTFHQYRYRKEWFKLTGPAFAQARKLMRGAL